MEYIVFLSGSSFLLYFTVIAIIFDLFLGSNEHSVAPWETAFLALDYLADVLYFDKLYPKLNEYLSQLVKPLFGDLGWTGSANDSMDTLKLRTIILKKNCIYGKSVFCTTSVLEKCLQETAVDPVSRFCEFETLFQYRRH